MSIKELRTKKIEDLRNELHALLQERFSLRMQKSLGKTSREKEVRREVARIKTILTEKKKAEDHGAKS